MENCPNCGTELKKGLLKKVFLVKKEIVDIINTYTEENKEAYCSSCTPDKLEEAQNNYYDKKQKLELFIKRNLSKIPVISSHSPVNWDYTVLEMVTGQSTTGTGVITEFTSSFTDFFGASSGRHNEKLKAGEDNCFNQLRLQTIKIGGNAVIATDIDYSEIGSGKGILMVCMAGTAVRMKNLEILEGESPNVIKDIHENYTELTLLKKQKAPKEYF